MVDLERFESKTNGDITRDYPANSHFFVLQWFLHVHSNSLEVNILFVF